jgi:hypothetical protein
MKTSMFHTSNFFRKNQRLLAASLLLASLYSCKKGVLEPTTGNLIDNTLTSTVTTNSISSLLYKENADGSSLSSYPSKQAAASYSVTQSTSLFYNGTKSVRFELRDTDPEVESGTRAELSFPKTTNLHRWYSYAMYIPSTQFKYDTDDDVITQFHQGGGVTPALCLRVKQDHLNVRILGTWNDLGTLGKDKWHSYILHVKHSSNSDGLTEIWIDGVKVFSKTGANAYPVGSTYSMPWLKMGIYKSNWNGTGTTQTTQRVIYFDDIKMGNEFATYNDMVPVPNTNVTTPPTDSTSTTTSPTTSLQSALSFNLVNADTEKDVLTITNGQTISLSALKLSKVNIRAVSSASEPGSIKFSLTGPQSKNYTDNKAPFALHGDNGSGNFYYGNWDPPALGTYTLKATPYTADNASGTAGASKTISFTITK